MLIWLASLAGFFAILASYRLESARLARLRRSVRARIGVTGTRGKSSVTRLVAAALRGAGVRTVAKTTGSRPMLIRTDGSEFPVERRGPPTILEQKRLLGLAAAEGARALVAEIMSILPENQAAESNRILDLTLCVVTNVRIDHADEQGHTKDEVAAALAVSVPAGGVVICPEGEDLPALRAAAAAKGATLRLAPRSLPAGLRSIALGLGYEEFEENLALALETCRCLGLEDEASIRAMLGAAPDLGALRSWALPAPGARAGREQSGPGSVLGASAGGGPRGPAVLGPPGAVGLSFVNAFAANDIESSLAALERELGPADRGEERHGTVERLGTEGRPEAEPGTAVGILNLRADRAERTAQWLTAVSEGRLRRLSALYVVGPHARLFARRARRSPLRCQPADGRDPEGLLSRIAGEYPGASHIVGLGNIAGPGVSMIEYCSGVAVPRPESTRASPRALNAGAEPTVGVPRA
jgi:hypothetical protein